MARILGMPQPGSDIPVKLEVTDASGGLKERCTPRVKVFKFCSEQLLIEPATHCRSLPESLSRSYGLEPGVQPE